ncbi:MAG TPA: hypothetical protein VEA99_16170, partial [Gemmatimonadaceae bacterium]|nr:hypothetical protein [Gemmatimonadaceae bacterium]
MAESARLDPIPSAPPPPRVAPRLGLHRQATGAVLALAVLVVANALFTPNFATASNLWNVLLQVSTVV